MAEPPAENDGGIVLDTCQDGEAIVLIGHEGSRYRGGKMDGGNPAHRFYSDYLDCINSCAFDRISAYIHDDIVRNDKRLGRSGYVAMLKQNYRDIPDLKFSPVIVLAEGEMIAARLWFDCTPSGGFMGLPINGRRVTFAENVFYQLRDGRIATVLSVIDKAAIEAQL